jgi:putative sigma-54 modulation protein
MVLGLGKEFKMKVSITARHFDLTPELRSFVEEELDKLKRYFDPIVSSNAVLEVEGYRQRSEITVKVYGTKLTGTGQSDDMYVSIEESIDRLKSQLKKHKGKLKDRNQKRVAEGKSKPPDLTSDEDVTLDY